MGLIVSPAKSEVPKLRTPLQPGEQMVLDLFEKSLSDDWKIYIQPHLNGCRPDFVLLHPSVGVAEFEVKDWRRVLPSPITNRHPHPPNAITALLTPLHCGSALSPTKIWRNEQTSKNI